MFKKTKKNKTKKNNQPKPGTLLQPVKPITKQKTLQLSNQSVKEFCGCQRNILTVKQHSQKPETCHYEKQLEVI